MKNYKYILFDWDGCLAKTLDVWLDAYKVTFAEYGVHPSDKEIISRFGDWEAPKYFGIKNIGECVQKYTELVYKNLENVEMYDGAEQLIKSLTGKRLALISTSTRSLLEQGLTHKNLENYFEVILSAEDVERYKPDPQIIEKALSLMGGVKQEAIIIGDSKSDLGAAKNAGIDSILFYPPENTRFYDLNSLKLLHPTHIVDDLEQVLGLV